MTKKVSRKLNPKLNNDISTVQPVVALKVPRPRIKLGITTKIVSPHRHKSHSKSRENSDARESSIPKINALSKKSLNVSPKSSSKHKPKLKSKYLSKVATADSALPEIKASLNTIMLVNNSKERSMIKNRFNSRNTDMKLNTSQASLPNAKHYKTKPEPEKIKINLNISSENAEKNTPHDAYSSSEDKKIQRRLKK